MTIMELNQNSNNFLEKTANKMLTPLQNQIQQTSQQQMDAETRCTSSNPINNEEVNTYLNSSRKSSIGNGSIATGISNIPASTHSLSSTSSATSSVANTKLDKLTNATGHNSNTRTSTNSQSSNRKYSSCSTPQTSRRSSGNSITIKITTENNINIEDEDLNKECFNENDELLNDDGDQEDGDDSVSISDEGTPSHPKTARKKLKERKMLVRSVAQQQHHLVCQESEEQNEESVRTTHPDYDSNVNNENYPAQNMNSAFDELFAAAETGNIAKSAVIEAKMAAAAAENSNNNEDCDFVINRRNSIAHSRNGSFRSKNSGGSFKIRQHEIVDPCVDESFSKKSNNYQRNLGIDNYLGSPQQLTRSCSCKRPSSFKRIRSKNSSPNRDATTSNNDNVIITQLNTPSIQRAARSPSTSGRRGTQCSITIMDNIESNMPQSRTGSLPFEKNSQDDESTEVYRVRQFNTTNTGSVINRGDSFKRSFKRSTHSVNNNKEVMPQALIQNGDPNTLNLPEFNYSFKNKSQNNIASGFSDINREKSSETCFGIKVESVNDDSPVSGTSKSFNVNHDLNMMSTDSDETFVVFMIGASSVGKNALIKQFKTSEYRGTYEICHSPDEEKEEVSIMLDGSESKIQFISIDVDMVNKQACPYVTDKENDAFIIVYSISDKSSFQVAIDVIKYIVLTEKKLNPIILVGNKSDLVRKRSVSREEGKILAIKYGAKFVETSVAINDKVDDLLAGILKQIRLYEANKTCINKELVIDEISENVKLLKDKKKGIGKRPSFLFLKTNSLRKRLFRHKNKEDKNDVIATNNGPSIFQKLFNVLFKKKSNQSSSQSVENLFSPSFILTKQKKSEK